MNLDFTTLAVALCISAVLQVGALFAQTKMAPRYRGVGWWTAGITSTALGFFAMFLRADPKLTLLGVFANNIFFVLAHLLLYVGVLRFYERREPRKILAGFFIFYALYDFYFVFLYDHLIWRGSALYLAIAALSFLTAWTLWKYRPRTFSTSAHFVAVAFVLHGLVFFAGFIMGLVIPPNSNSPSAPNPAQVLGLIDGLISSTLWTFGFILMVNQRLQKELEDLASTDQLTGLKNRRFFLASAQNEARRAIRYKYPVSLALIDLDNFKYINDAYGHPSGDQALITFAQRCQQSIRETDLLARFGGDEFAVLLPETNLEQAHVVINRIRAAITGQAFSLNGASVPVALSAGIACAPVGSVFSLDELVVRSDKALYSAKQAGRDRVTTEADPALE